MKAGLSRVIYVPVTWQTCRSLPLKYRAHTKNNSKDTDNFRKDAFKQNFIVAKKI